MGVEEADVVEWRDGAYRALTVLTVASGAVSIDVAEPRPLMFQPVPAQPAASASWGPPPTRQRTGSPSSPETWLWTSTMPAPRSAT